LEKSESSIVVSICGRAEPTGSQGRALVPMRRSEAKDAVMVREDYQHRIKFGSFKSRCIAKQAVSEVSGDFIDDAAGCPRGCR
jgi:hypothetical protein